MNATHLCPDCGSQLPPDAPQGECPRCLLKAGLESEPEMGRSPAAGQPFPATQSYGSHTGFQPPTVAELQARIPQYEIMELIGQGGMGAVYKAKQPGLGRSVAIKILPFEINQSPGFSERFAREARALALLSHPHIVAVHDFGQADGMCYFVMEYVDGVNLRQALQAGKMDTRQALAIVPQICDALQFAHDEGVVHRDIKPENILIDKRGRVKIADFGLAKLLGPDSSSLSLTGTQQVMGTLRYMAPEQMSGAKEVDHRADIFSLGVVFYELLTGELPIGRFALPSKKSGVDARLDDVVLRALESEPALRYQQVSELKTGLEAAKLAPVLAAQPIQPLAAAVPVAPHVSGNGEPRISRAAVWGAVLIPLFVLSLIMLAATSVAFITPVQMSHSGAPEAAPRPLWFMTLLMVPLLIIQIIGLLAPFLTTILGVIAISNIRHSRGKLYGMPLAVFDALLFPLLLLDVVLVSSGFFAFTVALRMVLQTSPDVSVTLFGPLLLVVIFLVPLVLLLNLYLIRLTWRAATTNMPGEELHPPPGKEPPKFQPQRQTTSLLAIVLIVLAVGCIPLVLCGGLAMTYFLISEQPRQKQFIYENHKGEPMPSMDHDSGSISGR